MSYGMKNMACNYKNAVSSFLQSQNWSDVAKKIADKELDKDYMVQRFSDGITNEEIEFVISKLTEEKKNITGLTRKSRVQYVIDKIKQKLKQNKSIGSEGGLVKTTSASAVLVPTSPSSLDVDMQSWFEKLKGTLGGTTEGSTTTETIPVQDDTTKKPINWLLIGGIGAGVITLGVAGYFIFRNKN